MEGKTDFLNRLRYFDKHCVFCGNKPNDKTKEHILPQWLIRKTGNPKRKAILGKDYYSKELVKQFSFDQFTFPACDNCNNQYARLESSAQSVIEKLLSQSDVSEEELDTILDWMDKIRVGIWLSGRYLSNNFFAVDPNFYIRDRISTADRALFITFTNASDGLSVAGSFSAMFAFMPCVLGLRINNMLLVSISTDSLISKEAGFPFISKRWATKGREMEIEISRGNEYMENILLGSNYRLPALKIYQPIFKKILGFDTSLMGGKYLIDNSISLIDGKGGIIVKNDLNQRFGGINKNDYLCAEVILDVDYVSAFGASVYELQNEMIKYSPSLGRLPKPLRSFFKKFRFAYAVNKKDIEHQLQGGGIRSEAQLQEFIAERIKAF